MGKSNTQTYNYAKQFLGQGGATFRKYCGLPSGAAWCNAFVTYIFHKTDNASLYCGGKKQTYCPNSIKWCKANLAQIPLYLAMPMDVIYFDWDKNGVPNHIGFVRDKNTTDTIYTIEGNTGNRVALKTRPAKYVQAVYRPHYKPTFRTAKLGIDGVFGYNSIAMLQKALGIKIDGVLGLATVKALQKRAGTTADGQWGKGTSKAVQGMLAKAGYYTGKIDGEFGPASVKGLQKWINSKAFPSSGNKPVASTPTVTKPTTSKPATTAKLKSYRIEVDLTNQICTVYGIYDNGTTKALMSEWVSTARKGKTTPVGNFKIQGASGGRKAKYRTAKLSGGKTYAEYACRFTGAKMMHGVPWKARNTKGYVYKGEFNKLGSVASAGCVRMPIKLARFIYNNCPIGTPVKVFKGTKGKYPMGKPVKYTATSNVDPTR